jgi:hypothetical protein
MPYPGQHEQHDSRRGLGPDPGGPCPGRGKAAGQPAEHPSFTAFHRVFNRNAWSGLAVARSLLHMVVAAFVPPGPIIIGVDHSGAPLWSSYRTIGAFHDLVRSTARRTPTSASDTDLLHLVEAQLVTAAVVELGGVRPLPLSPIMRACFMGFHSQSGVSRTYQEQGGRSRVAKS